MKAFYYYINAVSTKYAVDADTLATEIFFSFIFGAYTVFIWDIGGGFLSSVTGAISLLCLVRVIYIITEWIKDAKAENSTHATTISDNVG